MTKQSTPTPHNAMIAKAEDILRLIAYQGEPLTKAEVETILTVLSEYAAGWKSPAEVAELVRAAAEEAWERSADTVIAYMRKPGFGTVEFVNPYSKPTSDTTEAPNE